MPAIQVPVVETQQKQISKDANIRDWKQTPLYLSEMEGEPEVEAIVFSVPERDIQRIAGLSRDAADPFSFNSKILLALSLKSAADITEINY